MAYICVQGVCFSLRHLRRALHLPPHPHHCQQLQQVLRKVQNRGGDHFEEDTISVG